MGEGSGFEPCLGHCRPLDYGRGDFEARYLERQPIQKQLLDAVLRNRLVWVDGPGGSGKSTLVNWLIRRLLQSGEGVTVEGGGFRPVLVDVTDEFGESLITDEQVLEWLCGGLVAE